MFKPIEVPIEVTAVQRDAGAAQSAAFDRFYHEEFSRLAGTLYAMGGSRSLAEEVAQDAFAHAWSRWSRVSVGPSPAGWVYTTAFRMLRRRAFRERRKLPATEREPSDPSAEANRRIDIANALRELPVAQRRVVVMRYLVDLSTAEVAERLGTSEDAVRSTLHRARHRLQTLLEHPTGGDDHA